MLHDNNKKAKYLVAGWKFPCGSIQKWIECFLGLVFIWSVCFVDFISFVTISVQSTYKASYIMVIHNKCSQYISKSDNKSVIHLNINSHKTLGTYLEKMWYKIILGMLPDCLKWDYIERSGDKANMIYYVLINCKICP